MVPIDSHGIDFVSMSYNSAILLNILLYFTVIFNYGLVSEIKSMAGWTDCSGLVVEL